MKIGVFDSGLGGLSVLHCARKLLGNESFIYYADEKHVPYGEKTPQEIRAYADDIFEFMLKNEADAVIIACNTATSALTKEYRARFPIPIIGMEPAVKKAVDLYGNEDKRILVAATPVTIKGKKLHDLVEQVDIQHKVDLVEMPRLVRFAEKGIFLSPEVDGYLADTLSGYRLSDYGTVVLGCTHFNYFKKSFCRLFPNKIHFADGNEGTVRQMMRLLDLEEESGEKGSTEYYFSGIPVTESGMKFIEVCMKQLENLFESEQRSVKLT